MVAGQWGKSWFSTVKLKWYSSGTKGNVTFLKAIYITESDIITSHGHKHTSYHRHYWKYLITHPFSFSNWKIKHWESQREKRIQCLNWIVFLNSCMVFSFSLFPYFKCNNKHKAAGLGRTDYVSVSKLTCYFGSCMCSSAKCKHAGWRRLYIRGCGI